MSIQSANDQRGMTRAQFDAQMLRMAGLRFAPSVMDTHWEGLQGIPLDVLRSGVTHALISRDAFPSPNELRQDCDTARPARETPAPDRGATILAEPIPLGVLPDGTPLPAAHAVWEYFCETCSDTGWQSVWCGEKPALHLPWVTVHVACGRHGAHGSHEFVRQCACWHANPELVRKREHQRKYAVARTEKGRAA